MKRRQAGSLPPDARWRSLRAALRWGGAGLAVAGLHGMGLWLALQTAPAPAAAGDPPPAVMIDLAPVAVAPEAPPQDVAPGPQMVEAQASPQPLPEEVPPEERPPEPEPDPEPPPEPEIEVPLPDMPPPPNAALFLPPKVETPRPRTERPPPRRAERPRRPVPPRRARPNDRQAPRTTAPPTAQAQRTDTAAAPASGAASAPSASPATWRGALNAHLNRFKRFPSGASGGTAQVVFTIDRSGRVTAARLSGTSGDAAIDAEAVAMIRRASPVPAPPASVGGGGSVTLAVPVRFNR
jgi:protein TonB